MGAPEQWADVPILALANGVRVPLAIDSTCVASNEERYTHCEIAMRAGFPVLVGGGKTLIDAPCVLVGSGPSAIPLLGEIRARYERGEEIIAIKGAHDWLIRNGIVPRAAIALDPQQSRAKCFKRLRQEVLYLCASQMHPDTWVHLRGRQVLVWHSRIAVGQEQRPGWANRYLVPCCSTTGNSAIVLMHILGRRNFHLYGYDSSLPPVDSAWARILARIRGRTLKLDGARVPTGRGTLNVVVGNQRFETTAEMARQAEEIAPLLRLLPGIKVSAYGEGYYQALLAEGKARGWPV